MAERIFFTALTAAIAGIATPANADTLELESTSEWKLREYSDRCQISRDFAEGEDKTVLHIAKSSPTGRLNLTLVGKNYAKPIGPLLRLRFGDQGDSLRRHIKGTTPEGVPTLSVTGVTLAPKAERFDSDMGMQTASVPDGTSTLHIGRARNKPAEFALGAVREQLAKLDLCSRNLSVALETAANANSHGPTPPKPIDGDNWLWERDYPLDMWQKEQSGWIGFQLTVNSQGKPTFCEVMAVDRERLYNAGLCFKLIERARFEPARNANGEAVASYFRTKIGFKIKN